MFRIYSLHQYISPRVFGSLLRLSKRTPLSPIFALSLLLLLFTSSAHAAQATLAWNDSNNPSNAVGGYVLYYWQPSWEVAASVDVGKQTNYTLTDLEAGQTYHFTVAVYDRNGGNESAFSNEVSTTLGGTTVSKTTEGTPRVTEGLQVLYTFEEGSGTTVTDVSGVDPPLHLSVGNRAAISWVEGGLAIHAATVVASSRAATKVIEAVQATDEITIETWIKAANTTQDGPARIVTLSKDLYKRNFTLGQGLWGSRPSALYDARLRTTATTPNGMPSLSTSDGTLMTEVAHVVYTRDARGRGRIYIDGVEWAKTTVGGDFSNWNAAYRLALGNELTSNRPWLGEFHLVAIFDRALSATEVDQNFAAGPNRD